jgi:hypothetical protein
MTVCIAAIADKSTLVGASDRMLTAGDVQFEPEQTKMWHFLPSSIVALIAGDSTIQGEILKQVHKEIVDWLHAEPGKIVSVKAAASLYCKKYREVLRSEAEREILHPLDLDMKSFLAKQSTMAVDVVLKIRDQLMAYDFPTDSILDTIFIGVDNDGPTGKEGEVLIYPQLYVTMRDRLSWLNTVGFAAIGIGKSHAESQFMVSGHWPLKPFEDTLLLTYAAKKRAEVAPGVGKFTDIIVLGPPANSIVKVEDKHVLEIDKIYQKSRRSATRAVTIAQKENKALIERIREEYKQKTAEQQNAEAKPEKEETNE